MRNRLILIIALLLSPLVLRHSPLMAQYEVLTLDSCLSSARQHNCTIRSAALEVAISQELKKQMLWKYFPQVSLQGFAFGAVNPIIDIDVSNLDMGGGLGTFLSDISKAVREGLGNDTLDSSIKMVRWGATAQAQAVQPVFWGGQIVTANQLAKLGIDASRLKQQVSERDVLQEVADTYWMIAGLMSKRQTVAKVVSLLDTIQGVAEVAYNHGLATSNDLLRVQLKQNELRTKSLQLENGIQLASRLLCHMIGQPYDHELLLEPLPEQPVTTLSEQPDTIRVSQRPEMQLLEMSIRYNQLNRRLTLGESLPHLGIGITGGYNNFFNQHRWNAIAFMSLSIPLTGWGETAHKLRQHDLKIQQAELMQQDLGEKMSLQNRQIYDQLIEALKLMEQHRSSCVLAQDNYRISLMNYEAGVGTMTELMESEALLMQAENAYTDARITYLSAQRKFEEYNK